MQPYLFPYLGYFQLINSVDVFVVYDDVNYIKKGWINRNNILVGVNPYLFTIPVTKISQNRLINDHFLIKDNGWKKTFLKLIYDQYHKALYFNDVYLLLQEIVNYDEYNIAKFINHSIVKILKYLNIDVKVILSSSIVKNNELKSESKIIEICTLLGATEYINLYGGSNLYNCENFKANNIDLKFIKMLEEDIVYSQFNIKFVKKLSIIDVMMFNSIDKIIVFLEKYNLINGEENK